MTGALREPAAARNCAACGAAFVLPGPPVIPLGTPINGSVHGTNKCLRIASERFAAELVALHPTAFTSSAGTGQPAKTSTPVVGLTAGLLVVGSLVGLVVTVAFLRLAAWQIALVVLAIGVLAGLEVWRHARRTATPHIEETAAAKPSAESAGGAK
jgi:uncharacterized membrane protein